MVNISMAVNLLMRSWNPYHLGINVFYLCCLTVFFLFLICSITPSFLTSWEKMITSLIYIQQRMGELRDDLDFSRLVDIIYSKPWIWFVDNYVDKLGIYNWLTFTNRPSKQVFTNYLLSLADLQILKSLVIFSLIHVKLQLKSLLAF